MLVYGTFDYFHYGHYNFLKQAKALGDYLVVGVSTDGLCLKKGKKCLLDENKRFEIIKSLNFVDEVIFEKAFNQKKTDIFTYNIDIYAEGEDYKDIFPKSDSYQTVKERCEIVYLQRTPGVSTTELKEKLAIQLKLDDNKENLRMMTNNLRKEKEK